MASPIKASKKLFYMAKPIKASKKAFLYGNGFA
jgi:hypothetical protein